MRGRRVPHTGGHRLLGGAHISSTIGDTGLVAEVSALLPLWQNLYGLQLGVPARLNLSLRRGL